MGWGGALFAMSAIQGIAQMQQGKVAQAEANYNATVMEGQAKLIDVEKEIEYGKYQRLKGRTLSTSMANAAAMGIMPTGSPMAAMLDAQTQITIDQAIGQFNYDREKSATLAKASDYRRQGKAMASYSRNQGLLTILSGAVSYGMYKSAPKINTTTFDTPKPKNSINTSIGNKMYA